MTGPLTPAERQRVAQMALCRGIRPTARRTGHTIRTVRRWKQCLEEGGSFSRHSGPLSAREIQAILDAAPRHRQDSLAACRRRSGVQRSLATFSRIIQQSQIVMPDICIATYYHPRRRQRRTTIIIYYSVPRRLPSPEGPLQLIRQQILLFYTPRKTDYFLFRGRIWPCDHPLFARHIAPNLNVRKDVTAWFIRCGPRRCWHVIRGYVSLQPLTYCHEIFPPGRGGSIATADQLPSPSGPVCRKCQAAIRQNPRPLGPPEELDPPIGPHPFPPG